MVLITWYSFSLTDLFNWIGRICDRSFHLLQRLGFGPDAFYIVVICALLVIWMFMMRKYDMQAKDKGIRD